MCTAQLVPSINQLYPLVLATVFASGDVAHGMLTRAHPECIRHEFGRDSRVPARATCHAGRVGRGARSGPDRGRAVDRPVVVPAHGGRRLSGVPLGAACVPGCDRRAVDAQRRARRRRPRARCRRTYPVRRARRRASRCDPRRRAVAANDASRASAARLRCTAPAIVAALGADRDRPQRARHLLGSRARQPVRRCSSSQRSPSTWRRSGSASRSCRSSSAARGSPRTSLRSATASGASSRCSPRSRSSS